MLDAFEADEAAGEVEQRLMGLGAAVVPDVEATVHDLDLLVPACARAHYEEIGIDPLATDSEGFRWRTQAQIGEGRSWRGRS